MTLVRVLRNGYFFGKFRVPDWGRTSNLFLRREALYPIELRAHNDFKISKELYLSHWILIAYGDIPVAPRRRFSGGVLRARNLRGINFEGLPQVSGI